MSFFKRFLPKPVQLDDAELIRRYQDPDAVPRWDIVHLSELFRRYTHLIFGVCLKYLRDEEDAKDAVMQIYEKLVVELKIRQVSNFQAWLHVLTKNYCLMWLRARKSKEGRTGSVLSLDNFADEDMESDTFSHPTEEDSLEHSLQQMEKGLLGLPTEQKRCLELFYMQQKCYKEIAEITGYDLTKVKSYIQNGKRNLKIYVEKNNE